LGPPKKKGKKGCPTAGSTYIWKKYPLEVPPLLEKKKKGEEPNFKKEPTEIGG